MRRSIGARVAASVVVLLCAALAGAGCGSDDGGGSGGGPATLKVGVIPIADVAPLYLGMEKGFFKEENLTIKPKLAEGGAAIVPAVMSGDDQIGFSNDDLADHRRHGEEPAASRSSPRACSAAPTEDDAWDARARAQGRRRPTVKDLEGKTVAVNTLKNMPGRSRSTTRSRRRRRRLRRSSTSRSRSRTMNAALEAKRVDAAFAVEPVLGRGGGRRRPRSPSPYEETGAEPDRSPTYFATKQYIAENADVVDRFVRAMKKSLDYAPSNADEVRADRHDVHGDPGGGRPTRSTLPTWKRRPQRADAIERRSSTCRTKYGFIEGAVDVDDLIVNLVRLTRRHAPRADGAAVGRHARRARARSSCVARAGLISRAATSRRSRTWSRRWSTQARRPARTGARSATRSGLGDRARHRGRDRDPARDRDRLQRLLLPRAARA